MDLSTETKKRYKQLMIKYNPNKRLMKREMKILRFLYIFSVIIKKSGTDLGKNNYEWGYL